MKKNTFIYPRPDRDSWAFASKSKKVLNEYYQELGMYGGKLTSHEEVFIDTYTSRWYEYVPSSYNGSESVPLVVSCHAGHYFALAQVFDTQWCELAERENFIAVFPEALLKGQYSTCSLYSSETVPNPDNRDLVSLKKIIEDIQSRYNIDKSAVFIHGMSNGNMFALEAAMMNNDIFCGLGESSGPSDPVFLTDIKNNAFKNAGAMPCFQLRCEYDQTSAYKGYTRFELNKINRQVRMDLNGCSNNPRLKISGRYAYAYYEGLKADFLYKCAYFRNHCETVSDAEDCWKLFSAAKRVSPEKIEFSREPFTYFADKNAIALQDNNCIAYVNNKRHNIGSAVRLFRDVNVRQRGGFQNPLLNPAEKSSLDGEDMCVYFYAPVDFIAEIFNCSIVRLADRRLTICTDDGHNIDFADGNSAAVFDGYILDMGQSARIVDGKFCVPIDWFAEEIMNLCTAKYEDVIYIANHQVRLNKDIAQIIKECLS